MRCGCCPACVARRRCTPWTASRAATPGSPRGCGSCSPGNVAAGAPGSLVGSVPTDSSLWSCPMTTSSTRLLARGSWREAQRIAAVLRKETVGGALLLVAAAVALVWANSPWAVAYETLRDTRVGPPSLHLDLTLGTWAADGL